MDTLSPPSPPTVATHQHLYPRRRNILYPFVALSIAGFTLFVLNGRYPASNPRNPTEDAVVELTRARQLATRSGNEWRKQRRQYHDGAQEQPERRRLGQLGSLHFQPSPFLLPPITNASTGSSDNFDNSENSNDSDTSGNTDNTDNTENRGDDANDTENSSSADDSNDSVIPIDPKLSRFPPASEVLEMVHLSFSMYRLKKIDTSSNTTSCDDVLHVFHESHSLPKILDHTQCILYSHDQQQGTQVLVVKSTLNKYVAVVYAGTDDFTTALSDGDILLSRFGDGSLDYSSDSSDSSGSGISSGNNTDGSGQGYSWMNDIPSDVRIHRGFNNAVFANGGFDMVLNAVRSALTPSELENDESYRILTTGHSLGAADSVITAVALHLTFPEKVITSINFGCPKIGNYAWSQWLRTLSPQPAVSPSLRGESNVVVGGDSNKFAGSSLDLEDKDIIQSERRAEIVNTIDTTGDGDRLFLPHASGVSESPKTSDSPHSPNSPGSGGSGGVQIYRFVNGRDIVPRLPEYPFRHAGHTIQIDREDGSCCLAYFQHEGDDQLGFAGVPRSWDFTPLVWIPGAYTAHRSSYVKHLTQDSPHPDASYFQDFVRIDDAHV